MSDSNNRFLPFLAFFGAMVVAIIVAWTFWSAYERACDQAEIQRQKVAAEEQKNREKEEQIAHLRMYIDHLLKDSAFREMEARRHAGVAVEGEVIIREDVPANTQ